MKLRFEFARQSRVRPMWWLVILLGLAANVWCASEYMTRLDEVRRLQLKLSEYRHRSSSLRASTPEELAQIRERVKAAKSVADELNLPWGMLFSELSSLCDKDVVLLSVEPDAGARSVRVTAEARNTDAMFAFLSRGSQSATLKEVHLTQHHVVKDDPMRPIRFEVSGLW